MSDAGYYTFPQLCKTYGANACKDPIFPVSRKTFTDWVQKGWIPEPRNLSHKKVWPKKQIHELLDQIDAGEHPLSNSS